MSECKKSSNKGNCNCTYPCDKKGVCCDCLRYHLSRRELPACFFPADIEKTYDRSFEKFVELVNEGRI